MATSNCKHATCEGETCRREKKEKAAPKKIAKFSKKRQKVNREYFKLAAQFIKDNPVCEMKLEGCTYWAQHPHHLKGRTGDLLTDKTYWKAACDNCNRRAETHSKEAMETGNKLSKFAI